MPYPGLIKNRCGVYCYRLVFPLFLRQLGAPREVRFSLGTKSRAKTGELWIHAFKIGRLLLLELTELSQETDVADFPALLRDRIAVKREQIRLQEQLAEQSDQLWAQQREALQLRQEFEALNSRTKRVTAAALQLKGQLLEARRTGDAISSLPAILSTARAPTAVASAIPTMRGVSLETLINRFIEHSQHVDKLAASTMKGRRTNLCRFLDIIGPLSGSDLGASVIAHYRDVIRTLPANLTKKSIWKTLPDDLQHRPDWYRRLGEQNLPSLTEEGQKSHFSDASRFLQWLHVERYVTDDFSNMLTPIKNDSDYVEGGLPFTSEQLDKLTQGLWRAASRQRREQPKDFHFWAPLLGLTTGMRGDEIGRLTVADVIDAGGIKMLNVPGTKTDHSARMIPLPDIVLNAGFMQLVDWARQQGDNLRLFPDWKLGGGKSGKNYSASLGRWFNYENGAGLLAKLEIWQADQQVSFHSLRHSFATCAHHNDVDLKQIQMILGHGADLRKTYGLPAPKDLGATVDYIQPGIEYSPRAQEACEIMRHAINSIDFGCDLSGLNWLEWRKAKNMGNLN